MYAAIFSVGGIILVAVAGSYFALAQRLTTIETVVREAQTPTAVASEIRREKESAQEVCSHHHECYWREDAGTRTMSSPRVPRYDGEILP